MSSRFWEDLKTCLVDTSPLIKVLQLVDFDEKPAMGFIYEEINHVEKKIKANFENLKKRPLHAAAYYLNPQFHYSSNFKVDNEVMEGLYECLNRMIPNEDEKVEIHMQLDKFKVKEGLFGLKEALKTKDMKAPAMWWDSYGAKFPELQKFAIRILSLTCSSSRCKRNWSAFEKVHMKWRNCLPQKKMNDLIFVMYNLRYRKSFEIDNFEDMSCDDEWIAKKMANYNENTHERKDGDEGEELYLNEYEDKDAKWMKKWVENSEDDEWMNELVEEVKEGTEKMKEILMIDWMEASMEKGKELKENGEELMEYLMEEWREESALKLRRKFEEKMEYVIKLMKEVMKERMDVRMEKLMEEGKKFIEERMEELMEEGEKLIEERMEELMEEGELMEKGKELMKAGEEKDLDEEEEDEQDEDEDELEFTIRIKDH